MYANLQMEITFQTANCFPSIQNFSRTGLFLKERQTFWVQMLSYLEEIHTFMSTADEKGRNISMSELFPFDV